MNNLFDFKELFSLWFQIIGLITGIYLEILDMFKVLS